MAMEDEGKNKLARKGPDKTVLQRVRDQIGTSLRSG